MIHFHALSVICFLSLVKISDTATARRKTWQLLRWSKDFFIFPRPRNICMRYLSSNLHNSSTGSRSLTWIFPVWRNSQVFESQHRVIAGENQFNSLWMNLPGRPTYTFNPPWSTKADSPWFLPPEGYWAVLRCEKYPKMYIERNT